MNGAHSFSCLDQPPLARIAAVLPLYASGALHSGLSQKNEGIIALQSAFARDYERTLRQARLGILPFFLASSFVVWIWARRWFGESTALAAVFLFQGLPLVLAHAGLVTTDMAITALAGAAFYLTVLWLEDPSDGSALLGLTIGLAILSKHSAVPLLAAGVAPVALARWIEQRAGRHRKGVFFPEQTSRGQSCGGRRLCRRRAGSFFSWTPATVPESRPHRILRLPGVEGMLSRHPALTRVLNGSMESPIPLGDLVRGIRLVISHNAIGHPAFFLGEVRTSGWWHFFPVMIAVKTPIPFLILLVVGCVSIRRAGATFPEWQRFAPLLAAGGILVLAATSRINIGLRHILPVFSLLAVTAGVGLDRLASTPKRRVVSRLELSAAALVIWFVASSARAHPDYLPYFNELAGGHPERISLDSDLDWGQDVKRLFATRQGLRAQKLFYTCLGCQYLKAADSLRLPGAPPALEELQPYRRVTGWVAVSESALAVRGEIARQQAGRNERGFDWLTPYPFRRIGRSLRLYRVPPAGAEWDRAERLLWDAPLQPG
jgi:hypothetical protein